VSTNKKKILNDPVYGFITLKFDFLLDLIDHPYFQRLRRISQLGLSHIVYPGAIHHRFHHALGAMHLMSEAIEILRQKGTDISPEEEEAASIAILLHDIGHGPFSHALEHSIVTSIGHEDISVLAMERLNREFNGRLTMAIAMFQGSYHRPFFHQMVSGQLDMDRLDYLRRDSFYSGVAEGNIGSERIIKMLDVCDGELVVEEKAIYSIEKFVIARRLMYWQVYLHKTVISAEFMLMSVLRRARELALSGTGLFASPALRFFLQNEIGPDAFAHRPEVVDLFMELDDYDILGAIKVWQSHPDPVLSELSRRIIHRQLFKIRLSRAPISPGEIEAHRQRIIASRSLSPAEADHLVLHGTIDNKAYSSTAENIRVRMKDGSLTDAAHASDHLNLAALSRPVEKFFVCAPVD
jgi:uncharacterized protein